MLIFEKYPRNCNPFWSIVSTETSFYIFICVKVQEHFSIINIYFSKTIVKRGIFKRIMLSIFKLFSKLCQQIISFQVQLSMQQFVFTVEPLDNPIKIKCFQVELNININSNNLCWQLSLCILDNQIKIKLVKRPITR